MTAVPYHKRFRKLHPEVVMTTRELVKAKPWSRTMEAQIAMCQVWVDSVAGIYGIRPPRVLPASPMDGINGGQYRLNPTTGEQTIFLTGMSLTTLLHEFRHAMQSNLTLRGVDTTDATSMEDDARAWSLSLFYRAAPKRFKRMVAAGRILYMLPEDV